MTPVPDTPDTSFISLGGACPVPKRGKKLNDINSDIFARTRPVSDYVRSHS